MRRSLVKLSCFTEAPMLGRYLEVSFLGYAPRRSDYAYFITQVKSKMAKHLSFAGSITHSKSIIEALPIYQWWHQLFLNLVCRRSKRLKEILSVVMTDEDGNHKFHVVNWNIIPMPRYLGGLGIRRLTNMNKVCFMKLKRWLGTMNVRAVQLIVKGKYAR